MVVWAGTCRLEAENLFLVGEGDASVAGKTDHQPSLHATTGTLKFLDAFLQVGGLRVLQ